MDNLLEQEFHDLILFLSSHILLAYYRYAQFQVVGGKKTEVIVIAHKTLTL